MKRYIMIGAPVSTVRTPPLLETALAAGGVTAKVETRHLEAGELEPFMAEFRCDAGIDGLMVTMPHKQAILAYMDILSPAASLAGSVNAVKRLGSGLLAGAQFDGLALVNALAAKNVAIKACTILLAGLGGAGLAIAQAITAHGCADLVLADTNRARLDRALEQLGNLPDCPVRVMTSQQDFDLLINATPLGMNRGDPSPFDEMCVASASYVADIVADPPQTRLSAIARASDATLITGRDMVKGQIEPIRDWLLQLDP